MGRVKGPRSPRRQRPSVRSSVRLPDHHFFQRPNTAQLSEFKLPALFLQWEQKQKIKRMKWDWRQMPWGAWKTPGNMGASCESKCLFLEVWHHKVWLAVLDKGLFPEVKESYSGDIFWNRGNLQFARCDTQGLHPLRTHYEKLLYLNTVIFSRSS